MVIGIDAHNLEGPRTGVGRYLINLLHGWSKFDMGYQKSNIKYILYFKDEIPNDLPKSELFETRLLKVASTAKFIHWDLCRAAKKDRVDVLFCPGYIAPIFWQGKLALTLHDIIYETHPDWFEWQSLADRILLKWVSRRSAKKADVIFTPSEFTKNEVTKYYNIDERKIILTYEAADLGLAPALGAGQEIKRRYGVKNNFALFVGSIFNRRHMGEIISAFGRLAKEKQDWEFLMVGQDRTKPKQHIQKLADLVNEGLGRKAILRVDFVDDNDLKLLYRACAFFVWLSDYEGFGLPVLEAMSAGAPTITSAGTSLREVAGEAALLIKNNKDAGEIYRAMKKIVENNALRAEMTERGKEQAQKFSWAKCAEKTLQALVSI